MEPDRELHKSVNSTVSGKAINIEVHEQQDQGRNPRSALASFRNQDFNTDRDSQGLGASDEPLFTHRGHPDYNGMKTERTQSTKF